MYLWRHTSEHQQVTDFVIAFLNKAEIGEMAIVLVTLTYSQRKFVAFYIPNWPIFIHNGGSHFTALS